MAPNETPKTASWLHTQAEQLEGAPAPNEPAGAANDSLPQTIGRYQVRRRLGGGGFGNVFLCFDDRAQREVAVKVPRRDRLDSAEAVDAFLREARNVARLDHPHIVPLFDVAESDGQYFLVYRFVAGCSLRQRMNGGPIPLAQVANLIAEIAETLHYAHGKNLFHRDIKPANILLDENEQPFVTDFGLAIPEEDLPRSRGRRSGTFPYAAPEQIRGEGHRVDGRTDIYSLGVVLYELLCGRRPFTAADSELFEQILHQDVRPPRQVRDGIPRELERICLKAMAKQMSARYATARDLAEDLRLAATALASVPAAAPSQVSAAAGAEPHGKSESSRPSTSRPTSPIMPKGLRSFGAEDRDFFLELLPGPRDRDGLPEALRFWKTRIESCDPDQSFAVGLLYGPSGCGKSSLVKAGLLPRLTGAIVPVYVEAAPQDTEARLSTGLRKACPALPGDLSLPEMLSRLRRGRDLPDDAKVLIVIDQFEQWLHAHGHDMESSALLAALRHADGVHVQALLLVRDDFWMGSSRLFDFLEINLDRERNTRAVDLFDPVHARRVLSMFGQAFERLPAHAGDWSADQRAFLERAVEQLSQDGRIIPVRLSLFADLMKDRPWTGTSLVEVGGAEGVGLRFLEETFSARSALPDVRALEKPIRALLQALLPESGADIKGGLRSRQELAAASGLPEDSPRLIRLLDILDRELHIITPAELEHAAAEATSPGTAPPAYYQLTHDYLVQPLRLWLTQERRKSWRGRAELCLEERTAQWSRARDKRFLPTATEYAAIALGVPRSARSPQQQKLMRAASRRHGARASILIAVLMLAGFASHYYFVRVRGTAEANVQALLAASATEVPEALRQLQAHPILALPLLRQRFHNSSIERTHQLHAAFGMAAFGEAPQEFLLDAVATVRSDECNNLVTALSFVKSDVMHTLLARANDPKGVLPTRLRYVTVLLHLGEAKAAQTILAFRSDPSERTAFILGFEAWHGHLAGLARSLHELDDSAFRSGLCAAVGRVKVESLSAEESQALAAELSDLYCNALDGATHSAAGWALRQWKAPLPHVSPTPGPVQGKRWFVNKLGMTMVEIPGGTFEMGDATEKNAAPHQVTLTRAYFVGATEVRVDEFQKFVDDPAYPGREIPLTKQGALVQKAARSNFPVQQVSWRDAVLFCNWLSTKEGRQRCYRPASEQTWDYKVDANGYRLLTEAQWERACRAGTTTVFSFGNEPEQLKEHGIFGGNKGGSHPSSVASRLPNGFGLFDMHGNSDEWCWDWSSSYDRDETDPVGPSAGTKRIVRGGGWYRLDPAACGSAVRSERRPSDSSSLSGFRVACGVLQ